jgi:hypothetical protein
MESETMVEAVRLIYLSLNYSSGGKKIVSRQSPEMETLIQRFQAEASFRQLVEDGLKAMELRLLALEDGGLRLSARGSESFFASTLTDYSKLLARSDLKAADLLVVHCAIAYAFFPTEADFDLPVEDLGAIVIGDVIDILRRFSRAEETLSQDDDRFHPQTRTVAERLREIPEDNPDRLRAGAGNSWVDLVSRVIEHMADTGYLLVFTETPGEVEYRPTPGYQTAMREGIIYSFHAFRDFLEQQQQAQPTAPAAEQKDQDVSAL